MSTSKVGQPPDLLPNRPCNQKDPPMPTTSGKHTSGSILTVNLLKRSKCGQGLAYKQCLHVEVGFVAANYRP